MLQEVSIESYLDVIDFRLYDAEMSVDPIESTRDGRVIAVILPPGQLH